MSPDFVLTGRLVSLRPMLPEDIPDYRRWSDPTLEAWNYDGPWFKDDTAGLLERTKRHLAGEPVRPCRRLEIVTRDAVHIGWCVFYEPRADPHMCEVGIVIVESDYWNNGLGTEALQLWVDYQFRERGLTRIGFGTWSGNPRMIRVGQKLGFVREGCIRNGCEVDGRFYDRIRMGILRSEWLERRSDGGS